jgi:hypothetical protein
MEGINTPCEQNGIYSLLFLPKSYECRALAGLLACPTFDNLPVPTAIRTVVNERSKVMELTASGNAPDSHRIPVLISSDKSE